MADNELDVRQLRKPDKHPTIFASYATMSVGESLVLVNNHYPKHLHDEFEADHAGSYGWEVLGDDAARGEGPSPRNGDPTRLRGRSGQSEYVEKRPAIWQIRITRLTARSTSVRS